MNTNTKTQETDTANELFQIATDLEATALMIDGLLQLAGIAVITNQATSSLINAAVQYLAEFNTINQRLYERSKTSPALGDCTVTGAHQ